MMHLPDPTSPMLIRKTDLPGAHDSEPNPGHHVCMLTQLVMSLLSTTCLERFCKSEPAESFCGLNLI